MKTLLSKHTTRAFSRKLCYQLGVTWVLGFLMLSVGAGAQLTPALAQADAGTIAYVWPNDTSGDEIWLIEPDGSHDRFLWNTGVSGTAGVEDISTLAWHPQAKELAFASQHEAGCSYYGSDIYTIRPDGGGYRRVTAPPDCGNTAGMQTGTVRVTVFNWYSVSGPFVVYFQGAPGPQTITVAPYDFQIVVFEDVADYGSRDQWAVVSFGEERFTSVSAKADVLPGQSISAGSIYVYSANTNWTWSYPSWKPDGSQISYLLDTGIPYSIPANNTTPGKIGDQFFNLGGSEYMNDPDFLTWAPPGPRANQLLYTGWESYLGDTIYLATAGSNSRGEMLVNVDTGSGRIVLGLAWLPDSSGFLYAQTEGYGQNGNIYEYKFATQESVSITDFSSGYPRRMSVSPDGSQVVFEYQGEGEWTNTNAAIDLWMMDLNTGQASLFVEGGRAPAWSPQDLPAPVVTPTQPTPGDPKLRISIPAIFWR